MSNFVHKLGFSGFYALTFGFVSAFVTFFMFRNSIGEGWDILWVYTGSGAAITAFIFSKYFIEKPKKFNDLRLIVIAFIVGILSHWTSWYEALVVQYIRWKFFDLSFLGTPENPINGLYGAVEMTFISLLFFGWTAIPVSIGLIYFSKKLSKI